MAIPLLSAALTLAEMAPFISKWFTKDNEKIALNNQLSEQIVKIAKNVTGSSNAIEAAHKLEKNVMLLLRYQQEVMRLDRELETALLHDRQSARDRDIANITKGRSNLRADLMVVAAALGLITCLGSLTYFRQYLPGEAIGIISTIAGIFGSCLKDAYAFEFGSSRGSKAKDATVLMQSAKLY